MRNWVAADVAASLDSDGHFVFSDPPDGGGWPVSSRSAAKALANFFVKSFLAGSNSLAARNASDGFDILSLRETIEQVHGARIDWPRVSVTPWPPYFAASPVDAVADTLPAYVRRALGPRYHALVMDGSAIIADIAVSSDLSGVVLNADSSRLLSDLPSETVHTEGLAARIQSAVPLLPEVAVAEVAQRTGAKVVAKPSLVAPWNHFGPVFSRWRLHLDRDVLVRRIDTNEPLTTREILVGLGPAPVGGLALSWFVADPSRPNMEVWPFVWPSTGVRDSLTVRFSPAMPVNVFQVRP